MFSRKLKALAYPDQSFFDITDQTTLRKLVIWLEDRIFNTELTSDLNQRLRDGSDAVWTSAFLQYMDLCQCPFDGMKDRPAAVDWLLREAIRLIETHQQLPSDGQPTHTQRNCFANVHPTSQTFRQGLGKMAAMLNICPTHGDSSALLQAVDILLRQRLASKEIMANGVHHSAYPLEEVTLGIDVNDDKLKTICRILRLLHIHQLRLLQTQMDTTLVAIQNLTANPRTDSGLGRTGF